MDSGRPDDVAALVQERPDLAFGLGDGAGDDAEQLGEDALRQAEACPLTGQTWAVTSKQLEMISADPRVLHGQAVIAGTRCRSMARH